MIGFVKWLIVQYQCYKLEKLFKNDESKEREFISLFSKCWNYGFSEEQILYILNLVNASKGE